MAAVWTRLAALHKAFDEALVWADEGRDNSIVPHHPFVSSEVETQRAASRLLTKSTVHPEPVEGLDANGWMRLWSGLKQLR